MDSITSWKLYFGLGQVENSHDITQRIIRTSQLLRNGQITIDECSARESLVCTFRWDQLVQTGLDAEFESGLEEMLAILACASNEHMVFDHKLTVRIIGHEPTVKFSSLRANRVGSLLSVNGTVVRVGPAKPLLDKMAIQCLKCMDINMLECPGGALKMPTKCKISGCNGKAFAQLRDHPATIMRNWQQVKIQEPATEDGRVPRTLECQLLDDLVGILRPGDVVHVTGILKTEIENTTSNIASSGMAAFACFLAVNNVNLVKKPTIAPNIVGKVTLPRLIASFCPQIYGHEFVKFGLLLALFGGGGSTEYGSIRNEPHVLLVGDPGLGKSQLISTTAQIAPRGVYVCGNTSTAAGLTATVTADERSGGGHVLEAGALVLADTGVCCIDEFDKMTVENHRSLLDSMEQQCVSIAKAGIVCSLPARTSVIAAANPVGGHYVTQKSILENLKMDAALLSRFDLVFLLLDTPNQDHDRMLSEHILAVFNNSERSEKRAFACNLAESEHAPLKKRLCELAVEESSLFPPSILRSYIANLRSTLFPRMTREAADEIKRYYLKIRKSTRGQDTIPITIRQLESLVRLSRARARMTGESFITLEHAQDTIELM